MEEKENVLNLIDQNKDDPEFLNALYAYALQLETQRTQQAPPMLRVADL